MNKKYKIKQLCKWTQFITNERKWIKNWKYNKRQVQSLYNKVINVCVKYGLLMYKEGENATYFIMFYVLRMKHILSHPFC